LANLAAGLDDLKAGNHFALKTNNQNGVSYALMFEKARQVSRQTTGPDFSTESVGPRFRRPAVAAVVSVLIHRVLRNTSLRNDMFKRSIMLHSLALSHVVLATPESTSVSNHGSVSIPDLKKKSTRKTSGSPDKRQTAYSTRDDVKSQVRTHEV